MAKRKHEILAYADHGASNGSVKAINGRLEHLCGIALGLATVGHYIVRHLIHSGGIATKVHAF